MSFRFPNASPVHKFEVPKAPDARLCISCANIVASEQNATTRQLKKKLDQLQLNVGWGR